MHQSNEVCQTSDGTAERNRYFNGRTLTVDDLTIEQTYFRDKLRRHNRFVHGVGVVRGLEVRPAGDPQAPWLVSISPGYALGPDGNEILVAENVQCDLARCCPPGRGRRTLFITIEYAEIVCALAPVAPGPEESGGSQPTRIRESFVIRCTAAAPEPSEASREPVRDDVGAEFPAHPGESRLLLARVTLPRAATAALRARHIDVRVRRVLLNPAQIPPKRNGRRAAPAPRRRRRAAAGRRRGTRAPAR
jgi:hypothetical protein